jgi:hypothetical protein
MRFFVGLDCPFHAQHFGAAFISVGRLRDRKGPFAVHDWIMDSQAFTTIHRFGGYPHPVSEYAAQIVKWASCGNLLAAVSQDYMCEPSMLEKTGLTIPDHQRLTIERYDALLACDTGVLIMPVLQGYAPEDYVSHLAQYGDRLGPGAWVGVGSVCKRNSSPLQILDVLMAIKSVRPDLRLHGFGVKITALSDGNIRNLLFSADSMAWSLSARKKGRDNHDWREAARFRDKVGSLQEHQGHLFI